MAANMLQWNNFSNNKYVKFKENPKIKYLTSHNLEQSADLHK